MEEIKNTPVASNNNKNQPQVSSTAELRAWCARQRKFLVAERDVAQTPDANLIRVGRLCMLNNVESHKCVPSVRAIKRDHFELFFNNIAE